MKFSIKNQAVFLETKNVLDREDILEMEISQKFIPPAVNVAGWVGVREGEIVYGASNDSPRKLTSRAPMPARNSPMRSVWAWKGIREALRRIEPREGDVVALILFGYDEATSTISRQPNGLTITTLRSKLSPGYILGNVMFLTTCRKKFALCTVTVGAYIMMFSNAFKTLGIESSVSC